MSLFVDTLITASGRLVARWISGMSYYVILLDSFLLEVAATTLLFAMFLRYLPDESLRWKDTWFGALVTAVFFATGKYLIGIFIGSSETASLYDAAGSILVLMLWVYYASAIFLFGAAFTFVRARLLQDRAKGLIPPSELT